MALNSLMRLGVVGQALTLASNLINRSFLFLSNPFILTLKNGPLVPTFPLLPEPDLLPIPSAGGLTRLIVGAPKILGSRKDDEEAELVSVGREGEMGRVEYGVVGEFDHDGLILLGERGSIVCSV
jgi:hypothetical protein